MFTTGTRKIKKCPVLYELLICYAVQGYYCGQQTLSKKLDAEFF